MLDITLTIIFIIAAFIGVAWYARKSSLQRSQLLRDINNIEPEMGDSTQFRSLLAQEVQQQIGDNERFEIDADPVINLSSAALKTEPATKQSQTISIVEDEDIDLTVAEKKSDVSDDVDDSSEVTVSLAAAEQDDLNSDNNKETMTNIAAEMDHDWDMVIAFTIMARDDQPFSGRSVKQTLESLDMHFGDLQIYHREIPGPSKQTLYSVANIVNPGTLNPSEFATMSTPGLLVFSRLPGPLNGLMLFDELLDVANKITDKLGGILSDESKQAINQAGIEKMRSRILQMNIQLETEYNNDIAN